MRATRERTPPILVGALGGSGTRVVARLLRHAGVFMGADLNAAEDSEPVMRFYGTWLRRYLARRGRLRPRELEAATAELERALVEHLRGFDARSGPWGVKVPRNLLALPLWHRLFPDLRFVHVVRDGLDMAYSGDRNQLRLVGDLVLTWIERRYAEPRRAVAYWRRANAAAADYGESRLGSRYLLLRFEEVCARPLEAYARLCALAGTSPSVPPETVEAEVSPPATLGRWREHPEAEVARLIASAGGALERFGYGARA